LLLVGDVLAVLAFAVVAVRVIGDFEQVVFHRLDALLARLRVERSEFGQQEGRCQFSSKMGPRSAGTFSEIATVNKWGPGFAILPPERNPSSLARRGTKFGVRESLPPQIDRPAYGVHLSARLNEN
jgi:hypothetical protein